MDKEERIQQQINEQYRAIGQFLVSFEQLFYAIKDKIALLFGWTYTAKFLVEPYSVMNSISVIEQIILNRTKYWKKDDTDLILYKHLIKDFNKLNKERNIIIHTPWLVGLRSPEQTDIIDIMGFKHGASPHLKLKQYTVKEIDSLSRRCIMLKEVFETIWSIDIRWNFAYT